MKILTVMGAIGNNFILNYTSDRLLVLRINLRKWKNMKIIYLGKYDKTEILRGPEKVAKRLYHYMPSSVVVQFIDCFYSWSKFGIFKKLFGRHIYSDIDKPVYRLGIIPIFFHLIKEKPDIIHIITFQKFAIISFLYSIFYSTKIIYSAHGIVDYEIKQLRRFSNKFRAYLDSITEKIYINYSDQLVIYSKTRLEIMTKYFDLNGKKIKILPNGIDELFFTRSIEQNFHKEKLNILFIGDLNRKEKGVDFLFEFIELTENKFNLYIISNDTNLPCLETNDYIQIDLIRKVKTQELKKIMSNCEIYLCLSFYDQFPIAALECIASGLVSVITIESGVSEIIEDGKSGFLLNYGDVHQLLDILSDLNENRNLLYKISEEGRVAVRDLSWDKVTDKYKQLYESIIS